MEQLNGLSKMLLPSSYYHIYNRANGFENLFVEERNFGFFMDKWSHYIHPIATTHAWCLMPNHFHFLVKIKEEESLLAYFEEEVWATSRKLTRKGALQTFGKLEEEMNVSNLLSKQFARLFSSYSQSFNKVYKRKGSLFIPNFKYKEISSDEYLKQIILYIHNNPVHHHFTKDALGWRYSSLDSFLHEPNVYEQQMIDLFGGRKEFIEVQKEFKAKRQLQNDDMLDR